MNTYSVRRMVSPDEEQVVRLLSRTLGWHEDERHRKLFEWKHKRNPFGESPGWIAEDEQGIVGFRTLMRWEFRRGPDHVQAVRAVDTATEPRAQGRGIFRSLTLRAVDDMTQEGVDFIFNTPNARSMPGYLSMGWEAVGRLPVSIRPVGPRSLPKLLSSRTAGALWSEPMTFGEDAAAVLADGDAVAALLETLPISVSTAHVIRTQRSPSFLQWRYGMCPVGYRAVLLGRSLSDGLLLCRTRRRGAAVELVVADVLAGDARAARRLLEAALRLARPDYAVALGASRPRLWPAAPLVGPVLTWRALNGSDTPPRLDHWQLSSGDVELF